MTLIDLLLKEKLSTEQTNDLMSQYKRLINWNKNPVNSTFINPYEQLYINNVHRFKGNYYNVELFETLMFTYLNGKDKQTTTR